ncbi:hypothetical protein AB0I60_06710 [Actinosynnema sp. NPDC050436]|uniref:hypothetical protein n=1 Tax=Actinosynnema sp. NPDC050436 TaxID=3155659 RepID=UPI0033D874BD
MRALVLIGAVLATTAAAAGAAHGGVAEVRAAVGCDFTGTATFQPGVRHAPQRSTVTVRATGRPCGEPGGPISGASFTGRVTGELTCTRPDGTPTGTGTVTWRLRDGRAETSTVDYALSGSFTDDAALDGAVVAGRGVGGHFRARLGTVVPEWRIACGTVPGLAEATATGRFDVGTADAPRPVSPGSTRTATPRPG